MSSEVKVCKLVSGELIIADVEPDVMGKNIKFKDPMHVIFAAGPTEDQISVQMIPFFPFMAKGSEYDMTPDKVMCWIDKYPASMKQQFMSITSNIVVPNNKNVKVPQLTLPSK